MKKKEKLFDNLGNKDPNTIPILTALQGKEKEMMINIMLLELTGIKKCSNLTKM